MRNLTRHVGPGFQSLRAFEIGALTLEIGCHLIEVLDEPPEFVRGGRGNPRVEVAASDSPRGACESTDRIGDPFGHPVPEGGAEQTEQYGGEQDTMIQLIDLLFDLLLPQRQRHGDDPFASAGTNRRRGQTVPEIALVFFGDKRRQPVERDRAVHVGRRAHRQQPRLEEIALARGLEAGAIVQIDILVDRPTNKNHDLIVDRLESTRPALLKRGVVFDEALRDGCRACGRVVDTGPQLGRKVCASRDRQDDDRDNRARDEGIDQLAVEARSKFAKQCASAGWPS